VRRLLLGAVLAPFVLVPTGVASAAPADVQAVDGTAANGFVNSWAPQNVTINAGDTVTWRFTGTQVAHNVASNSPNWNMPGSPIGTNQPPVTFRFNAPGTYSFICQIHPEMTGNVLVGAPGQPPPPPPQDTGPQPLPNETGAPGAFESGGKDNTRPRVSSVRVSSVRRGARVRFRVSERSRVTIRFMRGGRTVKTKRVSAAGRHTTTVRSRRLRAGRYRVQLRAQDLAGNRSRSKHRRVTLR
jgi:plastocyanin